MHMICDSTIIELLYTNAVPNRPSPSTSNAEIEENLCIERPMKRQMHPTQAKGHLMTGEQIVSNTEPKLECGVFDIIKCIKSHNMHN